MVWRDRILFRLFSILTDPQSNVQAMSSGQSRFFQSSQKSPGEQVENGWETRPGACQMLNQLKKVV